MKVIGEGGIHVFDEKEEGPHKSTAEEWWQESWVVYAWDEKQDVYVFLRMAQVPNKGVNTVWLNAWTPEYEYKTTKDNIPDDQSKLTETSIEVGNGLCRYKYEGGGIHQWHVRDHEAEIDITYKDLHPAMAFYNNPDHAQLVTTHIDTFGTFEGTVKIRDRSYRISGPGWRDKSWRNRDWWQWVNTRFFPAFFNENYYVNFFTAVMGPAQVTRLGYVIRDNSTIQFTQDVQILAYVGDDGVSNGGGRVTFKMDGKTHVIEHTAIGRSAVSANFGFPCVDAMTKVVMDDMNGVGISESMINPFRSGKNQPFMFDDDPYSVGIWGSGIFPRKVGA